MYNWVRVKFQFCHSHENKSTLVCVTVLPYICAYTNGLHFPTKIKWWLSLRFGIFVMCLLVLAALMPFWYLPSLSNINLKKIGDGYIYMYVIAAMYSYWRKIWQKDSTSNVYRKMFGVGSKFFYGSRWYSSFSSSSSWLRSWLLGMMMENCRLSSSQTWPCNPHTSI